MQIAIDRPEARPRAKPRRPSTEPQLARGAFDHILQLRHVGPRRVEIRFEAVGAVGAPVVVVAGGISAHRHVAHAGAHGDGWWGEQVGPGAAIDTRRFRVVSIDWLGSDGQLNAPIDSSDQADAVAAVLDFLGVRRIVAWVGASYGAMVGLQFAARHAGRIGSVLAISGGDRAHPYASAWRAIQRRIVRLAGNPAQTREALALARQLAMLSYRSREEFAERFDQAPVLQQHIVRTAAEDYLEHCGERYVERTSASAFLRLSESIDLHRVAAADITVPVTLVAVEQDQLVPACDLARLAAELGPRATLRRIDSCFGHDAFLTESALIADILRGALNNEVIP